MKNKQHLKSFEGDLFYIDIIWTTGDKPATFEVRATNADTDVTTTITNQSAIVGKRKSGIALRQMQMLMHKSLFHSFLKNLYCNNLKNSWNPISQPVVGTPMMNSMMNSHSMKMIWMMIRSSMMRKHKKINSDFNITDVHP